MIISVLNRKGGCGKTTLATVLATMSAKIRRYNTLLIDADEQQDATDNLTMEIDADETGRKVRVPIYDNLTCVPSYRNTPSWDKTSGYDFVIIDNSPKTAREVLGNIIDHSDVLVIPYTLEKHVFRGVRDIFEILPDDKEFDVFPVCLVSKSARDTYTDVVRDEANEFFKSVGLSPKDVVELPLLLRLKNNINIHLPFYQGLSVDQKRPYYRLADTIFNLKRK